jgi:hypothetical protein
MKNLIYKDPVENEKTTGNSSEDEWQKMDFLFHSACSFPFVPMLDLSFVTDGLLAMIKNWKQKGKRSEKKTHNKESHATI